MKLYRIFGLRKEILQKIINEDDKKRQLWIYNWLGFFIIVLSLLGGFAAFNYIALIFNGLWVSITVGLIFSLIFYNLLMLMMVISIAPRKKTAYEKWVNKDDTFAPHLHEDLSGLSEEKALQLVYSAKDRFRDEIRESKEDKKEGSEAFLTLFIKIAFVVFLGVIVANGCELFLFRNKINDSITEMQASPLFKNNDWLQENIFANQEKGDYIFIRSNSILLPLNLLQKGLGNWKIFIDLIFTMLYALPFVVFRRSKEFSDGAYINELVLSEMTIAYYHYLTTRSYCQKLRKTMEAEKTQKIGENTYSIPE